MRSTTGLAAATLAAIVAAALTTALPVNARGPGDAMGPGPLGMMGGPDGEMIFEMFDTNADGSITTEELTARRAEMVSGIDANNDGKLSAEELAAQEMRMMQAMAKARADERIERLDVDGDQLLSVEELAVRPGPEMIFERLDANGDGTVTRAEADEARERMENRRDDGPRGHRKRGWMDDDN